MGGGAIKKGGVSICNRLPKAAYTVVKQHVLATLAPHVSACEAVLELPGKMDFGDLDILYTIPTAAAAENNSVAVPVAGVSKGGSLSIPEVVKSCFSVADPAHMVRHGPVTSFAFNVKELLVEKCPEFSFPQHQAAAAVPTDDSAGKTAAAEPFYFQVDFIKAPSTTNLAMCRFYFGYGDVGGILGRVFNYYGIKFGEAGIWCELYSNTVHMFKNGGAAPALVERKDPRVYGKQPSKQSDDGQAADPAVLVVVADGDGAKEDVGAAAPRASPEEKKVPKIEQHASVVDATVTLGRIPLSADPAAICEYAGMSYDRWCQGFTDVDQVVAWLTTGHLYHPDIFDRLNYDHMCRAKQRPFYQKFLAHINMQPGKAGATQVRENKQLDAVRHFKQVPRLEELIHVTEVAKERRAKFNGKLLAAAIHQSQLAAAAAAARDDDAEEKVSPIEGKSLGAAISNFKAAVVASHLGDAASLPLENKQEVETAFNVVLDELSAEAIETEMLAFASKYEEATPVVAVEATAGEKKKNK